jgi:DNA-binding SARP family transcriptional activator/DNA-binding beta-propeller fold protein YncE
LLLHANEPVARDQLIEELWGDEAPATVKAVLNVYLSRLRRLLADDDATQPLLTQAAGYVLSVPPEHLDARCFEDLLEQGRRELARGKPDRAAATLRSALALWRGSAFADLAYQRFAQNEISRLEELRLAALEERIESDLELGRHDALVPELEALIAHHPYRERLYAQLMLALYRSGRQAEALDAYRRARQVLAGELGLEPGPQLQELERSVLRHDASLDAPTPHQASAVHSRAEAVPRKARRRQTRVAALAITLGVLIAAAVVGSFRSSSNKAPAPVKLVGNSVAVIDPDNDRIVAEIPIVGGRPAGIAAGSGSIWVVNRDDKTLVRIDSKTRQVVHTIGLGLTPTDVRADADSVWVLSNEALLRIDPAINAVADALRLPRRSSLGFGWILLAVGKDGVWVCSCSTTGRGGGALARIEPATGSVASIREGPVGVIAYGEGALWALTGFELNTIERIDPRTLATVQRIPFGRIGETYGGNPGRIAAGEGAVWVAAGKALWRLDPATDRFTGSVPLGHTPQSIAIGDEAVWVVADDGTVLHVDPRTQTVAKSIPVGFYPTIGWNALAVDEGAVWVAITGFRSAAQPSPSGTSSWRTRRIAAVDVVGLRAGAA